MERFENDINAAIARPASEWQNEKDIISIKQRL